MSNLPGEHSTHLDGPEIPDITGWYTGIDIFGTPITTTVLSTWIFMVVLFIIVGLFYIAITTDKFPKLKTLGLDAVSRLDNFLVDTVGQKKYARIYFPMLGGFFVFILLSNFFGLILDYLTLSFPFLHSYIRPFNSDMSTTLAMAVAVIIIAHIAGMIRKGFIGHWKHYFFNYSGNSALEKGINVPIGWIHLVSELTRIISLSVRLFANIFAGVALIAVISYLGSLIPIPAIGQFLVLPIWFFELLVACIQAFIFMMLSSIYIKEAVTIDENH